MTDIPNIKYNLIFDNRIVEIETHTCNIFTNTTFGYSDEIRLSIQQQGLHTLPYKNFLYIEGKLMNRIVEGTWHLEIIASRSYSMRFDTNSTHGMEIDRVRNVGMLKNYVTASSDRSVIICRLSATAAILVSDTLISVYCSTYCWDSAKIYKAWWSTLDTSWF